MFAQSADAGDRYLCGQRLVPRNPPVQAFFPARQAAGLPAGHWLRHLAARPTTVRRSLAKHPPSGLPYEPPHSVPRRPSLSMPQAQMMLGQMPGSRMTLSIPGQGQCYPGSILGTADRHASWGSCPQSAEYQGGQKAMPTAVFPEKPRRQAQSQLMLAGCCSCPSLSRHLRYHSIASVLAQEK